MLIRPARSIRGSITIPGDKSISHRAAILSALAEGESEITNYLTGEDCLSTIRCLRQMGVEIEQFGTTVRVKGVGRTGLRSPDSSLDCGNSGTTMRLLAGVLAGQDFESTLTGDESLCRRPMNRIIGPLQLMGAEISSDDGKAPLTIRGQNPLNAISYTLPVASAQVKSCILLAGLNATGQTTVVEPVPTRDHTERMLLGLGADIKTSDTPTGKQVSVSSGARLSGTSIDVPSDISGASFFVVAATCLGRSNLKISNVGINPSRSAVLEVLKCLGVNIDLINKVESLGEPSATLHVTGGLQARLAGATRVIDGQSIANLIDEIPILSVFGTQIEGGIEVRDASELRVKETDRISAIVENLERMGADVEEYPDGFSVGRSDLQGANVNSFGDHRIAMAFAIAGLFANGNTTIIDAECADISFPGFYELLESVVQT